MLEKQTHCHLINLSQTLEMIHWTYLNNVIWPTHVIDVFRQSAAYYYNTRTHAQTTQEHCTYFSTKSMLRLVKLRAYMPKSQLAQAHWWAEDKRTLGTGTRLDCRLRRCWALVCHSLGTCSPGECRVVPTVLHLRLVVAEPQALPRLVILNPQALSLL